jgi:hypothetical protein
MIDRNYAITRLKSRAISKNEFNYDILSAPPILSMFTVDDIDQLYYLATSPKYSAKLDFKYKEIDRIMRNRGFEKLVSGTNRVAYAPTFANNFIVKVAYDSVAIEDSIREYRNQFLIKPFCTKVFEVSPNGVLGVFEKVNPITSRKEYISLAADIYTLLSEFIIGEYIIDDIGTEYFNNIGFRYGFGAVVLDFPYVYKVDQKKIWCSKPDYKDPTGYCNGPIDYDMGFNKLVCKKCGAIYKPFELASKKIEYIPLIQMKEREEINMKIKVSGGTPGIRIRNQEIETGEFRNPVNVIKSKIVNKKVEKELEEEEAIKTVNGVATPKVEEEAKEDRSGAESPIVFDESLKGKKGDPGYASDNKNINDLEKFLSEINNLFYYSDNTDEVKSEMIEKIIGMLKSIIIDNIEDNIEIVMKLFADILRSKKNLKDEVAADFLKNNSCSINNQFIKLLLSSNIYNIDTNITNVFENDDGNIYFGVDTLILKTNGNKSKTEKSIIYSSEDTTPVYNRSKFLELIGASENELDESEKSGNAEGFNYVTAITDTKKNHFPTESVGNIIVVKNDDDTYLTLNNKIIAITSIDDRDVNDIEIVSKDWYDSVKEKIELLKEAPVGSLPEEEDSGEE